MNALPLGKTLSHKHYQNYTHSTHKDHTDTHNHTNKHIEITQIKKNSTHIQI